MDVETLKEIVATASNAGTTIVMLGYFIFRDLKVIQRLEDTLSAIEKLLTIENIKNKEVE